MKNDRGAGDVLSGDSWEDERVVESSQKIGISKNRIENENQACYSIGTQMNSNICKRIYIYQFVYFKPRYSGKNPK